MVYVGTAHSEAIVFHVKENPDNLHIIFLSKECDEPAFTVSVYGYNNCEWKFSMLSPVNYEMVKHMVMDAAFEADDVEDLIDILDDVFEDMFADIILNEDDNDNDNDNEDEEDEDDCACRCGCIKRYDYTTE